MHSNQIVNNPGTKCPFMSESKKKTRSGCPLEIGEKRRCPALDTKIIPGYNEKYISPLQHILSAKDTKHKQTIFKTYPVYLQHTLFHLEDQYFTKIRKQTIDQRYLIFEQLKELANKQFHKEQFQQAITLYEQANSLIKYLECTSPSPTIYNDNNTQLVNSHLSIEKSLQAMGESMLFQVYLSMAVTYMKLNNYALAQRACKDAIEVNDAQSMAYYRHSQSIVYNQGSTEYELQEALQMIDKALTLIDGEVIFKQSQSMLVLLGLGDAQGCYERHKLMTVNRIQQTNDDKYKTLNILMNNAKLIQEMEEVRVREDFISREELNNQQRLANQTAYSEQQQDLQNYYIVQQLEGKYYGVISHFQQSQNYEQIKIAKRHQQNVKDVLYKMKNFFCLNFFDSNNKMIQEISVKNNVNINEFRIKKRLRKLAIKQMEEIFNKAQFNYEMYVHTLQEFLKKQKIQKEQREKKQNDQKVQIKKTLLGGFNSATICPSLILAIIIVSILFYVSPKRYQNFQQN